MCLAKLIVYALFKIFVNLAITSKLLQAKSKVDYSNSPNIFI